MKKQRIYQILILALLIILSSCENYVTDIDPPIDQVKDDMLTSETEIPFVITGVKLRFGQTHDRMAMLGDLLSDALIFDYGVPRASSASFDDINKGYILTDNSAVSTPERYVGRLRFYGDDLVRRVDDIDFEDTDLKNESLYVGYFFGGVARYYYASYFGLTENQGGGCIDGGPFIPSAEMYDLAIEKFESALDYTTNAYEKRVTNSLIARCYLFNGDYDNARTYALNGLVDGDAPFQALHDVQSDWNYYWAQSGQGRPSTVTDWRFNDYVTADPTETARIPLVPILGNDWVTVFYLQDKYPARESPTNLISWQENELMLAELDLRAGDAVGALTRMNNVRSSHGLAALASADMNVLIEERDKELFVTGIRLIDQRRFDIWHLAADTWRYLPITNNERNANPNID